MSKELNFADGYDEVKYLDNSTNFDLILTENNIAFDLSRADAISIKISNDDGYIMEKDIDPKTITNYQSGEIIFPIDDSIMNVLVPDDYYIEVWLKVNPVSIETDSESATFTVDNNSLEERQSIFPSTGLLGFTIDENISSTTGEVIPTITFDQFKSQFNDMMAQMDNAVHNIHKGDKGDKGDTGQGLEVKDKVSDISNLPSTGNEGDGYLVGEELYVWINGAWKDCGSIQGPQGIQGIQGIQGEKGDTGNGVSSTTIQYQISNSATNTPTGTWSNNIIATTQDNPYLWLQATLNYTDGTKKIFYLVSTKGDKGDKGDQGIQGVQGEKGDTGAGLQVKGEVNNVSQLPTTGQDGYCYFVGTDMYVWTDGKWNNMGDISPDLSNYVTLTDMNNGLSTKVTDNKDGTEQLNGVQVQPFNKLSDTIGTRNYALGTLNSTSMKSNGKSGTTIQDFPLSDRLANLSANTTIHYSYDLLVTGADGGIHWAGWSNPWNAFVQNQVISSDGTHHFEGNAVLPSNEIITGNTFHSTIDNSSATYQIENLIITVGDTHVDYLPAPEDKADDSKVVHTADMRKPASDVAGIEEVNAKQDKIGYTPADDSKVVHSDDLLGGRNYAIGSNSLTTIDNGNGNNYPVGLVFELSPDVWGKQVTISYTATISGFTGVASNSTESNAYVDLKMFKAKAGDYSSRGFSGPITKDGDYSVVWKGYIGDLASGGTSQGSFRTNLNSGAKITISKLMVELGEVQHDWVPAPEDKADDSKVAHLSGDETIAGNKFFSSPIIGTLKTYEIKDGYDLNGYTTDGTFFINGAENLVNYPTNASTWATLVVHAINTTTVTQTLIDTNNDIYVRTLGGSPATWSDWIINSDDSKVAHLSGANNFDTTPTVNNNPLLLASSLPSDLARTGQDTNFTGKLQKSGSDVATTADVTTAVNTATSSIVTTDKLANFTAGLQSGGVSVATSDDLKSVEESAWRVITSSNGSLASITFLYKINSEGSYLDFMYTAVANSNPPSSTTIIADLSGVISGISRLDGCWINIGKKIEGTLSYSGTQIIINSSNFTSNGGDVVIGTGNKGTTGGANYETGRVYYTALVNN